ncbi:MAG: hypothetical protein LBG11_01590, partial [Bifidobacteriaceae bacterium]|nr:hypothetical protein [Bifidobacteriaceae bacterium]
TDQWLTLDLGRDWAISEVRVTPYSSYAPMSVRLSIASAADGPFKLIASADLTSTSAAVTLAAPTGTFGR